MKRLNFIYIALSPFVLGVSLNIFAQQSDPETPATREMRLGLGFPQDQGPWQTRLGIGVGAFAEYEGADQYDGVALPLIELHKPGRFFFNAGNLNPNDGAANTGVTLIHYTLKSAARTHQLLFGPLARAYPERNESDSEALTGMGNIDASVGVGAFLEYTVGKWLLNLSAAPRDVSNDQETNRDRDGLLTTFDIRYKATFSKHLHLTTNLSTSWADDDYMQGYYGVTTSQAAKSGFAVFSPEAGFKDVGLQFRLDYEFAPHWWLDGRIGYWRLLNDAAKSPLVDNNGSADQFRGLIGIKYEF